MSATTKWSWLGGTLAGLVLSGPLLAQQCSVQVEGNDAMKFDKSAITIPAACKEFTVTLKHVGKLPKAAMGHNWVLVREADLQGVSADALAAGPSKDYLKPGDSRVIATTRLLGGGETDSVTFPVAKLKAGDAYVFFCSFPGHGTLMKGTVAIGK